MSTAITKQEKQKLYLERLHEFIKIYGRRHIQRAFGCDYKEFEELLNEEKKISEIRFLTARNYINDWNCGSY